MPTTRVAQRLVERRPARGRASSSGCGGTRGASRCWATSSRCRRSAPRRDRASAVAASATTPDGRGTRGAVDPHVDERAGGGRVDDRRQRAAGSRARRAATAGGGLLGELGERERGYREVAELGARRRVDLDVVRGDSEGAATACAISAATGVGGEGPWRAESSPESTAGPHASTKNLADSRCSDLTPARRSVLPTGSPWGCPRALRPPWPGGTASMSKVILCADDSVTMQTVAEITFRTTEYGYLGARSADEAIEKVKAQRPVLVLADAVMPGKTGYELCHALKSDPATADIPVVILCGNSAPFDGARGTQVGADGSLTKPWDTQVMLDKVVEILDKVAATASPRSRGPRPPRGDRPPPRPRPMAAPAPAAPPVAQIPPPAAAMTPLAVPPVGPAVNPAAQIAAAPRSPRSPRRGRRRSWACRRSRCPARVAPARSRWCRRSLRRRGAPVAQAPVAQAPVAAGPGRPGCGCPSAGRPSCAAPRPRRPCVAWRRSRSSRPAARRW
jgi:CheY-like chemotaxis protein